MDDDNTRRNLMQLTGSFALGAAVGFFFKLMHRPCEFHRQSQRQ
jgi:hypothetical protein